MKNFREIINKKIINKAFILGFTDEFKLLTKNSIPIVSRCFFLAFSDKNIILSLHEILE